VPDAVAAQEAMNPDGDGRVTLAFLMDDYITHLQHHVAQIRALLTA
jgi:hypothetical protein